MSLTALLLALTFASAPTAPTPTLAGKSEADVRAELGSPIVARREDRSAMWTYRTSSCALYVYFRAAGREGLRVTGASSGPRRRGEAAPDVGACLKEARAQAPRKSGRDGQSSATGQTSHLGRRATQV